MSLGGHRACSLLGRQTKLLSRHRQAVSPIICAGQTRTLTSDRLDEFREWRGKPWPYKTRKYNWFWQFFDYTIKRLNENSKIIVVDGPMHVGKNEFAKKLAKQFDMHYIPPITMEDLHVTNDDFDLRELNDQLPRINQFTDLETFYKSDGNPKSILSAGSMQLGMYVARFWKYHEALLHLFSTGQGVVLPSSMWMDSVYGDLFYRFNYYTKSGFKYYRDIGASTKPCLWRPHLTIHLDAPLDYIKEQIKKRKLPGEENSKVLTDDYINYLRTTFNDRYLPTVNDHGEVLSYDVSNMEDWDIIVEDIESLDLEKPTTKHPDRFFYWNQNKIEADWSKYRLLIGNEVGMRSYFYLDCRWDIPEIQAMGDNFQQMRDLLHKQDEFVYKKGWRPADKPLFKIF